jgi:hypothetical protein
MRLVPRSTILPWLVVAGLLAVAALSERPVRGEDDPLAEADARFQEGAYLEALSLYEAREESAGPTYSERGSANPERIAAAKRDRRKLDAGAGRTSMPPLPPGVSPLPEEDRERFAEMVETAADLRALEPGEHVPIGTQDAGSLSAFIGSQMDEALPPDEAVPFGERMRRGGDRGEAVIGGGGGDDIAQPGEIVARFLDVAADARAHLDLGAHEFGADLAADFAQGLFAVAEQRLWRIADEVTGGFVDEEIFFLDAQSKTRLAQTHQRVTHPYSTHATREHLCQFISKP